MNHLPYREWLFASSKEPNDVLTPEQLSALNDHLEECSECRSLAESWQTVEGDLRAAPQVSPEPGFTARWQDRLVLDRQRRNNRQGVVLIIASFGVGMFLMAVLVFLAWPLLSTPSVLIWTYLYQVLRWISIFGAFQQFAGSLFHVTDLPLISPLEWVFIFGFITTLCVLWVVSYRVLTNPRSVSK